MSRSMIQAAVTMGQLQQKLDTIGHNLANSQTTGYKSRQAEFSSLLFQQIENLNHPANGTGRLTPDGIRIGSGARLGAINSNMNAGNIVTTDRMLDTALLRENYFYQIQVTENNVTEIRYTRDGAFYLSPINDNGDLMLVTKDGHPVLGANGPIVIEPGFDSIQIQNNGQIIVSRNGQTETAGSLAVVEVTRPRILEAAGNNMFRLPDLAALGYAFGEIVQAPANIDGMLKSGALEQSNVDIAEQMSELILTQRSYQFNARTISTSDQMMGLINQLRT
ncbi:flagellar hook-basal body complex protein FlhP [Compostibacillus humi]|uniref:Flagellar hook-basal body complex protein FlhP n=1 Tax=Compostibacillus humi TaxID=1245525 RepID=A0A8J3EII1_9BACI|nr:flagellar hook-basal body protein [Compostibacillus humi]GGH70952.1 flagellar hook-basal body complex protein FlhP [Compostibacillus humi]